MRRDDDKTRTSGLSSRRASEGLIFDWLWLGSGGRSWDVEWRSTSFGAQRMPSVCGRSFRGCGDGMSMCKFCCCIVREDELFLWAVNTYT